MSVNMNELNKIYEKIYDSPYSTSENLNKKNNFNYKYLKLLMYLQYILVYILFYFHSQKSKIIEKVSCEFHKDYIIIFFLMSFLPLLLYIIYEKFFTNKKTKAQNFFLYLTLTTYIFYCLFLIIYKSLNLIFIYKSIYYYEQIFFNIFQFFGIGLPFIFFNQLILLAILLFFIILKYFINSISYNLFGLWGYLSIKNLLIPVSILSIYILSSIFLDIFFKNKKVFKQPQKETKEFIEEKITDFNKINEIYNKIKDQNVEVNEEPLEDNNNKNINKPTSGFTREVIDKIYINIKKDPNINVKEDLSLNILALLKTFYIEGEIFNIVPAATVTNYFFKAKSGTKTSRIESIEEELSMELNRNVRVASNIKGIVFEVANKIPNYFSFKDLYFHIDDNHEDKNKYILPLFLGFDTFGENIILDLTKQPHLLMAGTTGSGKSSTLHTIIHSLIINKTSEEVKFLFIDPKILELSIYKDLPYLWKPIITSIEEGEKALEDLIKEMEIRYKTMAQFNKRSIIEYNKNYKPFPYIVFAIEEFADLALYKNSSFKTSVQRLAQMGRAAGIHGIICTQRPSVNVIDGVIKANFPTRIALKVANKLESRIILDTSGAEKLTNPGEMIILDSSGIIKRGICPYIREEEIINLINFIKNN